MAFSDQENTKRIADALMEEIRENVDVRLAQFWDGYQFAQLEAIKADVAPFVDEFVDIMKFYTIVNGIGTQADGQL